MDIQLQTFELFTKTDFFKILYQDYFLISAPSLTCNSVRRRPRREDFWVALNLCVYDIIWLLDLSERRQFTGAAYEKQKQCRFCHVQSDCRCRPGFEVGALDCVWHWPDQSCGLDVAASVTLPAARVVPSGSSFATGTSFCLFYCLHRKADSEIMQSLRQNLIIKLARRSTCVEEKHFVFQATLFTREFLSMMVCEFIACVCRNSSYRAF